MFVLTSHNTMKNIDGQTDWYDIPLHIVMKLVFVTEGGVRIVPPLTDTCPPALSILYNYTSEGGCVVVKYREPLSLLLAEQGVVCQTPACKKRKATDGPPPLNKRCNTRTIGMVNSPVLDLPYEDEDEDEDEDENRPPLIQRLSINW